MRVLLDENLPHDLIGELTGHDTSTVQGLGWAGVQNGELLRRAAGLTDALLTMDRKLEHQHDISGLPFELIVIRARSNGMQDLRPLVVEICFAMLSATRAINARRTARRSRSSTSIIGSFNTSKSGFSAFASSLTKLSNSSCVMIG